MPWASFGTDIGKHSDWGILYDSIYFENFFQECENFGVNYVRFWLHCDGRGSPEFDSKGFVTGLDSTFFLHLDDVFERAKNHKILIILCLWSHDILIDRRDVAGDFAGNHKDLIEDENKTDSYLENALIPMVKRYKNQCNLLAFEIINEPEWGIKNILTNLDIEKVSKEKMQIFVGKIAASIHQHSNKMVTLGSASLKWNSNKKRNFWSDEELKNRAGELAYLDFYSIHYFDWMDQTNDNPFRIDFDFWELDKPCLIGEFPAKNGILNTYEMIQNGFYNGWAGALAWSYAGRDGAGKWENVRFELSNFRNSFPVIVDFDFCDSIFSKNNSDFKILNIYPNPFENHINIEVENSGISRAIFILIDVLGKNVWEEKQYLMDANSSKINLDIPSLNSGIYFLKIIQKEATKTFKLIKK